MKWNGMYVAHDCRNPECNNGWIDKDLTKARNTPPKWKYCRECCEKLGIDFDSQTPTSNLTEKELAQRERNINKLKAYREKINSLHPKQG